MTTATKMRSSVAIDARGLKRQGIGFYPVVKALVDEVASMDVRCVLVTDEAQHASTLKERYPDCSVELLPATTWLGWEQVQLARLLARLQPTLWIAPTNYGVPLLHPRRTQTLLIVHDLIPLIFPRTYLQSRVLWAGMYLTSLATSFAVADAIVTVSRSTSEDVRRLGRRRSTVIIPPLPERRQPMDVAPEHPYVLYNGGFDSRKNVPALLEAFSAFSKTDEGRSHRLVILGDREDIAVPLIEQYGLVGRAEVTGFVGDERKWELLGAASVIAYPSSYEGFGLVAAEAFAAGTPLVSGTGGALAEVGGAAALFIDPTDIASILDGLRSGCLRRNRQRMREAGYRQLALLKASARSYRPVIEELCARRHSRMRRHAQ